eukprot:gnl/MRDRNA2_/MRDRNA2_82431_c1_seq1.p1 gnl/MRDRNA2_/MRDRNA2_82431_c1~~gnl/MRDRNA2_/MRDRNA2_82431_c1_seq1.p1  ORF type:complete len:243 (-),score=28.45 gnl/MRDRNA2_/MRDRNA2_82431_c1_seq1:91-819(-)
MAVRMPNDGLVEKSFTSPESAQRQASAISPSISKSLTVESLDESHGTESNRAGRESLTAKVGSFPDLPASSCEAGFTFDPTSCSSLMEVAAPNCLRCHSNATRNGQGVCFLIPSVQRGEQAQIRFRLDNKPGRMRYFLGVARKRFGDAPDSALRAAGWSIENLYAGPHSEKAPCNAKATPLFHTGSIVTLSVDLRDPSRSEVCFAVDTTNANFRQRLPSNIEKVEFWVSLYNRFAQFTVLDD